MTHVYQTITWIRPTSTEVPCFNRSPQTRRYVTVTLKRVTGGLNSLMSYTLFFKSLHRLINIRVPSREVFWESVIFLALWYFNMGLCSWFWTGWYVFNGGNATIPTHCVTEYHCGTKYPVWMKGTLPSVGVTASRQGCIALTSGTSGSCCELPIDIKVKNCGHFYVYHLKPTPFCPAAYCAGMYT